jgi:aspartyl-tRNA(Asn)/glutamyl-tRNA(Gln) amidotransferase subunit A
MSADLTFAGVGALADAYRRHEVTPEDVVRAHLARIEARDPHLRAYITVTADLALKRAAEATRDLRSGRDRGPLHGIPYAVKDQVVSAGVRTTAGSRLLADWIPRTDAAVIERMDAAGAVLLGKLNMMEFALGRPRRYAFGTPRNPWNAAHETGGSSSGCGVAAAADLATVTIGEDTGGSIRHPAAHCGTVGLRPTAGLVSRAGMIPAVHELDTLGPLARSVEDVARVLGVIAGPDPRDPTSLPAHPPDYHAALEGGVRGLRIGVVRELLPGPELRAETERAVHEVAETLTRAGARRRDVSIPLAVDAGIIYTAFAEPEAARVHLAALRTRPDLYDANVRIRLARGLLIPAAASAWARDTGRRILVEQIAQALTECDLLLAPAAPGPAPPIDDRGAASGPSTDVLLREFALQFGCRFPSMGVLRSRSAAGSARRASRWGSS